VGIGFLFWLPMGRETGFGGSKLIIASQRCKNIYVHESCLYSYSARDAGYYSAAVAATIVHLVITCTRCFMMFYVVIFSQCP
jgi:hypothetical protein